MTQKTNENTPQDELIKLTAKIKRLAGKIEANLNSTNELEINNNTIHEVEKQTPPIDSTNNKGNYSLKEAEVCCNMYSIQNPLFIFVSVLMACISAILFLYLANLIYKASNPTGIEANQSDLMFFDYLVTDIFTIHNRAISSHSRDLSINFNTPYGVNFNNMTILPDGTIIATNCNFSELSFQKIKIRGSTILTITPQNDEVIFNLPTIYMDKSLRAMELDCSGFTIKNGKLFDSTGLELTWPSPGDSRYSFLPNSRLIAQSNFNQEHQIFNIHPRNTIINSQNLPDDFKLTDFSSETSKFEKTNYIIPQKIKSIKENYDQQRFNFKCSNITASYDSFACIPTNDDYSIIFAQCFDSKCRNAKTTTINISDYLSTRKMEKMLIFNNEYISILENQILYIFNKNGTKIDIITNVDYIDVIDDGISRYLLYLQSNDLYQYPRKLILSFQNLDEDKNTLKNPIKFSSEIFKSKLIIFSNRSNFSLKSTSFNEDVIIFYNQGNIDNFIVDRYGDIFAIDSISHQILICDIKENKCENLFNLEAENNIQILPLNRGGFLAISTGMNSELSYHFLNRLKTKKFSKIITTKTSETADEIVLTTSKGKYPRIFALNNGIPIITQCSNSKCLPGFAN